MLLFLQSLWFSSHWKILQSWHFSVKQEFSVLFIFQLNLNYHQCFNSIYIIQLFYRSIIIILPSLYLSVFPGLSTFYPFLFMILFSFSAFLDLSTLTLFYELYSGLPASLSSMVCIYKLIVQKLMFILRNFLSCLILLS